jgi:hypothetical protein
MMDKGEAHRFEIHVVGFTEFEQPRFFKYERPRFARGDILVVESLVEEADDTVDRGDQTSESLAESLEGGVRAS